MEDDEDRAAILARRNRFVAMALAGLASMSSSCDSVIPGPCLEAPPMAPSPPQACLDVPPPDMGPMLPEEPTMGLAPSEPSAPRACLRPIQPTRDEPAPDDGQMEEPAMRRVPPPPRPHPCLQPGMDVDPITDDPITDELKPGDADEPA